MKPRRPLRFSLRTMLVLLLVLSIPLAWLAVQLKWIRDRREALRRLMQPPSRAFILDWRSSFVHERDERTPWSLKLFGEEGERLIFIRYGEESELKPLRRLFPEAEVTGDVARFLQIVKSPPANKAVRTGQPISGPNSGQPVSSRAKRP